MITGTIKLTDDVDARLIQHCFYTETYGRQAIKTYEKLVAMVVHAKNYPRAKGMGRLREVSLKGSPDHRFMSLEDFLKLTDPPPRATPFHNWTERDREIMARLRCKLVEHLPTVEGS